MVLSVKGLGEALEKYKKENDELKNELAECKGTIETMKREQKLHESIPIQQINWEKEDQNKAFDKMMMNLEAMEKEWKEDLADMIDIIEPKEPIESVKASAGNDIISTSKEDKGMSKIIQKLKLFKCDQCQFVCNTKDERIEHHILMHQKTRGPLLVVRKGFGKNKDDLEDQSKEGDMTEEIPEENLTYYCDKCDHRTDSGESLESHKNTEHMESQDPNNEKVLTPSKQNLSTFQCDACKLYYTSRGNLARHNRMKH